jgi:hypothetical protein
MNKLENQGRTVENLFKEAMLLNNNLATMFVVQGSLQTTDTPARMFVRNKVSGLGHSLRNKDLKWCIYQKKKKEELAGVKMNEKGVY